MIHFLIYEYLKKKLAEAQNKRKTDDKTFLDFAGFMLCGACSKTCATIVAYPHGKFYKFGNLETYFCWPWKKTKLSTFWICAKNFDFYTTKGRKIELNKKNLLRSKKSPIPFIKNHFSDFWISDAFSVLFLITEVARTRLREENSVYRSFWQTLFTVYKNEGRRGLYRGLVTQLIRQIPNTAIMMSTYELTVYVLTKWLKEPQKISHNSSWQLKRDPPGDDDEHASSQQK